MSKVIKKLKIPALVLLILLCLAGAYYGLLYFNILKTPAVIKKVPVLGEYVSVSASAVKEETELDKLTARNEELSKSVTKKDKEISSLEDKCKELEKKVKLAEGSELKLKEEISRLNSELIDLKTAASSQQATYKDMAVYFAAMKTKDAADIIARLEDEDIIGILEEMQEELAAEILQNMEREKAVNITRKMLVTTTS